jgi:hypothetical protein
VKKEFARLRGVKVCGMARALEIANIPLEGTHHRGSTTHATSQSWRRRSSPGWRQQLRRTILDAHCLG